MFLCGQFVYADDVAVFKFVTDPQTIDVGQVSKDITIQSQNASGAPQPIPETYDVVFTSTSGTGSFLNSSGNAVSTVMSKNTANRTFFYKDTTQGDFVMTVTATGRESKKVFTATQHIFVGVTNPDTGGTTASTTDTTATTTTEEKIVEKIIYISSAHSSPAPVSTTKEGIEFEISAGRDRLASVGNTVLFRVVPTRLQNLSASNIVYKWSFGDGTVGTGDTVSHMYRFSGDYAVVVNGSFSDKQAVSRLLVKVISPDVALARVVGGVEVWNKSSSEINLEGWSLVGNNKVFNFPADTIIGVNKKIVFANEITGMNDGVVRFVNSIGKVFASLDGVDSVQSVVSITSTTPVDLNEISQKIETVKNTLAMISVVPKQKAVNVSQKVATIPVVHTPTTPLTQTKTQVIDSSTQVANVVTVFEAPQKTSVVSSIFEWPTKGFNFIRRLFVEE
ncbi:MAG: hypothetical protein QG589_492 [Patescibacteria group bacterium]|nr:hypothetical protein [Patescibacteria group bacterium]